MSYPEYAEVDGKKYKINTDFRIAIECNRIAEDETIGNYERALAIIYILFGNDGLENTSHHQKLLEIAKKYLSCGKEIEIKKQQKPDMDFIQDMDYIEASFMSDFNIDLSNETMHWWKFNKLMNGLSYSELGNSCILNRIRSLRNINPREIKDTKERKKIIDLQNEFALKRKPQKKKQATEREKESAIQFIEMLRNRKR